MITCSLKLLALAALAFVGLAGSSGEGLAQTRTFVSQDGKDSNDCFSPAAACRGLEVAVDKVQSGGTVFVQGPYTETSERISKSVNILGAGNVEIDGINIPSSGLNIKLSGINFNGNNRLNAALILRVASKISLSNCSIVNYAQAAIQLNGPAGARVALDNVEMSGNQYGVTVQGAPIDDVPAERGNGALVGQAPNTVFIKDSFIDTSAKSAVEVRGAQSTAVLINSTLAGSGQVDLSRVNGGKAISYGNNVIRSGTASQTLATN